MRRRPIGINRLSPAKHICQTNDLRTAYPRLHKFGRYEKDSKKGVLASESAASNYESIGDS